MGDTLTLTILAAAGVLSILLYAAKGILDQLPDFFHAWHNARKAWRDGGQEQEPEV